MLIHEIYELFRQPVSSFFILYFQFSWLKIRLKIIFIGSDVFASQSDRGGGSEVSVHILYSDGASLNPVEAERPATNGFLWKMLSDNKEATKETDIAIWKSLNALNLGDRVMSNFKNGVITSLWNKALWLVVASHVTSLNQSDCSISRCNRYETVKFVYNIC